MPAMPAKLKLCGVRGDGTEVEVESGLPDRAMLARLLPPRLTEVFSSINHVSAGPRCVSFLL
jgi:hypothetical protein